MELLPCEADMSGSSREDSSGFAFAWSEKPTCAGLAGLEKAPRSPAGLRFPYQFRRTDSHLGERGPQRRKYRLAKRTAAPRGYCRAAECSIEFACLASWWPGGSQHAGSLEETYDGRAREKGCTVSPSNEARTARQRRTTSASSRETSSGAPGRLDGWTRRSQGRADCALYAGGRQRSRGDH
jgi:hypothetical protein